jgi:hypothetical protein
MFDKLEKILPNVQKPGRYIGGRTQQHNKR